MGVYLDFNSTTPLAQEVLDVVKSVAESSWFNPSSPYDRKAKDVIRQSRQSIAKMLNANPNDFLFTSGGTESNFLVFNTFSRNSSGVLPLVITSNIEHPSVLLPLSRLEMLDLIELKIIPVNPSTGVLLVDTVLNELRPNRTILISIMLANNETGAIMPIEEIVHAVRAWESKNVSSFVFIHSDVAQAVGKLPLDLTHLGLDYATIVGHKFYGPRIGCLFVRGLLATKPDAALNWSVTRRIAPMPESGAPLVPLFLGGGQEFGFRSGCVCTLLCKPTFHRWYFGIWAHVVPNIF
ncbi:Selenocysteine lyase [Paragonimus heterotremus]|uniref:Selenocysteine lyase n=1 Tax=Paragonimus heterotremus TaxID=100268 RepID=A0A8J4SIU5_9TREM|nr:Selenocysteine lyase [Paragonimus heterotremus]